jgi:protease I
VANVNCFERRYQHENEDFSGLKIAILVDDGFEQTDLAATRKALDQAGAETRVVSPKDQWVRGWNSTE